MSIQDVTQKLSGVGTVEAERLSLFNSFFAHKMGQFLTINSLITAFKPFHFQHNAGHFWNDYYDVALQIGHIWQAGMEEAAKSSHFNRLFAHEVGQFLT